MDRDLKRAGIGHAFYLRRRMSDTPSMLPEVARDAAAIVADDYPTAIVREFNRTVPGQMDVAYHAVDSSCIIPMSKLDKREYAAYTIRPKITRLLDQYLLPCGNLKVKRRWETSAPSWHCAFEAADIPKLVASCEIDHSVAPSPVTRGGPDAAEEALNHFVTENLKRYAAGRNEPAAHATSGMSPYLHFGHISSLQVALRAKEFAERHKLIAAEFLEELIVRRELAFNYARHVENPATLANLPEWALVNMKKHAGDARQVTYTPEQLLRAQTHDELWNAAQKEMLLLGRIHGYYRMYWGKKIIEWSVDYEQAFQTMVEIHDRYSLDGRDPNTYTNILWCFGLHDRPWPERPVFGTMRYMSFEGMKRKTNIRAYIDEIQRLEKK
jgi:deoxyribodipyrimidine photo-lyase